MVFIQLQTSDNKFIRADVNLLERSRVLQNLFELLGKPDEEDSVLWISLQSHVLLKVLLWGEFHRDEPEPNWVEAKNAPIPEVLIPNWDKEFLRDPQVLEIMMAADYLDMPWLMKLCAQKLASLARDETPKGIRKRLQLVPIHKPLQDEFEKLSQRERAEMFKSDLKKRKTMYKLMNMSPDIAKKYLQAQLEQAVLPHLEMLAQQQHADNFAGLVVPSMKKKLVTLELSELEPSETDPEAAATALSPASEKKKKVTFAEVVESSPSDKAHPRKCAEVGAAVKEKKKVTFAGVVQKSPSDGLQSAAAKEKRGKFEKPSEHDLQKLDETGNGAGTGGGGATQDAALATGGDFPNTDGKKKKKSRKSKQKKTE